MPSRLPGLDSLNFLARLVFVLSGFLTTGYLLRDREGAVDALAGRGRIVGDSWFEAFRRIVPLPYAVLALGTALYLPGVEVLAFFRNSDLAAISAMLDRNLTLSLARLGRLSFESYFWSVWPLAALLAPRRLFLPIFVAALGSGPMHHLWNLFGSDVRPTSILVAPSASDLLAAGAVLGILCHRDGPSTRSNLVGVALTALAFASAPAALACWEAAPGWGSVAFLTAPAGFGMANFVLELSAAMLVAWLARPGAPGALPAIGGASAR